MTKTPFPTKHLFPQNLPQKAGNPARNEWGELLPGYCVKQTDSDPGLSKSFSLKQVPVQVFGHVADAPPWGCTVMALGS